MTISVAFAGVANAIGDLTVSGVNIKGVDKMITSADGYLPLFCPFPDNFITDISFTFEAYGTGGTAPMNLEYTMNWVYYHSPLGASGNSLAIFQKMLENIAAILKVIFTNDSVTGAVDVRLLSIGKLGPVFDASGGQYHGALISLRVLEFVQ